MTRAFVDRSIQCRSMTGRVGVGLAAALGLVVSAAAQPANNSCVNAIVVGVGTYSGTTIGASNDGAGTCGSSSSSPDVWYSFIAPFDGTLTIQTCGSTWDTVLGIWNGCPSAGGTEISCNDDSCGLQSNTQAFITINTVYLLRVAGYAGTSGAFTLTVSATEGGPQPGQGADVVYSDITDLSQYGPLNNIYAYSLGTATCNNGNANLGWGNSYFGSPEVGFNAYRLYQGRLVQLGLGMCKQACCAGAGSGCAIPCNGMGGSVLGSGCRDVYGAGYNASQSRLAARSAANAFTGIFAYYSGPSGDAIYRRLQIKINDMNPALVPNSLYFLEGVYVARDDAAAGNANNNASYKRVTIAPTTYAMTMVGAIQAGTPAIQAWHDHGLGANLVDNSVHEGTANVPSEGRFHYAYKVTNLNNGTWRYDYAVFNLNSDKSGGSFSVAIPAGVTITPNSIGFHDVDYHSGEPYDNTDWTSSVSGGRITWSSPQTFAQNANSNALRWGTMYNFWFEANRPPADGNATLGLFKPHTPQSVQFAVSGPIVHGDMNCDGVVNNFDIDAFVLSQTNPVGYAAAFPNCNINAGDVNSDGAVNNFDIDPFVGCLTNGCP